MTVAPTVSPGSSIARQDVPEWHVLEIDTLLADLGSTPDGLAPETARDRLATHGPNTLPRPRGPGVLTLLWRQVNTPLVYVLVGAALLALALDRAVDGLIVLGVVVANTLIGFVQEYRAGRAIEALMQMVPDTATVIRAGVRVTIPADRLVPGDVVALQAGDRVPADARLLSSRALRVSEAALTGESAPVDKTLGPLPLDTALADRRNLVYGGTLATYGIGTALVVATGAETELGRISAMLGQATHGDTPLTRSLASVGRTLTVGILAVAALLVAIGLGRGYTLVDATLAAITLAVAAIPEGLPAIITIALAIGVQRMARRHAVIRRLPAVETLGGTTVICTDKTGTLTRNEMTVRALWTPADGAFAVGGVGYEPRGELTRDGEPVPAIPEGTASLLRAAALCSDATLRHDGAQWHVDGDPTEGALVVAAWKVGATREVLDLDWTRVDVIPFDADRQFMATLHLGPAGRRVAFLKGAPEVVLRRCARAATGARLDAGEVHAQVERLAGQGMRVLAVAERPMPADATALVESDVDVGLTFLGLAGMIDPPRPEAAAAVAACHRAGIAVKMITGDHRRTAQAIGGQLGLRADGAVTGAELERLDDAALLTAAETTDVFARVAPEHKLRLVRLLQSGGQVVAMTGDGVNDAPALKQADIGVAMGITGTAVSREAGDMVLTDDNFASIAAAVEEGRRVYDNLVKALAFVLPTNLGEALILLVAVLAFPIIDGVPLLPMAPVQILWINLVATVTLALPLALEAHEPAVMRRPPRRGDEPLLSRFVLARTVLVALLMAAGAIGLFLYEYWREVGLGVDPSLALREAQTMAVTSVVLMQVFYLLNCRSLRDSVFAIGLWSNPMVYAGIALLLLFQAALIYHPAMHAIFGTASLPLDALGKAALVAASVLPVIGVEKWWRRREERRRRPDRATPGR